MSNLERMLMARVLTFGDIHGNLLQLDALLGAVKLEKDDRLIFLGDYVDRGPASAGVLARLMQLKGTCDCAFIMGNHEEMMIRARGDRTSFAEWIFNGGDATLKIHSAKDVRSP